MGLPSLLAVTVLWFGWFVAPAVDAGFARATFWELLSVDPTSVKTLMEGPAKHGLLSLIGLMSIAAPLGALYFKGRPAALLNVAPLGFLVAVYVILRGALRSAVSGAETYGGDPELDEGTKLIARLKQDSAVEAMWLMLREFISWGFWLILAASLVLFVQAFRRRPTPT